MKAIDRNKVEMLVLRPQVGQVAITLTREEAEQALREMNAVPETPTFKGGNIVRSPGLSNNTYVVVSEQMANIFDERWPGGKGYVHCIGLHNGAAYSFHAKNLEKVVEGVK